MTEERKFERELQDLVNRYLIDGLENRDRMIDALAKAEHVVRELDAHIAAGDIPDPRVYAGKSP